MSPSRNLPRAERLSLLIATILLAYAVARFVQLPGWDLNLALAGVYLPVQINVNTLIAVVVAGITASGADWLLSQHPEMSHKSSLPHWLLPAFTAWVLSVVLSNTPLSPWWWITFAAGGGLLLLVLIAEYITVDPDDARQPAAAVGLVVLSLCLFLMLAISLRASGLRLLLTLPPLGIAAGLVSLRATHLRLDRWQFLESGAIALFVIQIAAALHYLPIQPISYGLALLGPLYALITFSTNLAEEQSLSQAIVEPLAVLGAFWLLAVLFQL